MARFAASPTSAFSRSSASRTWTSRWTAPRRALRPQFRRREHRHPSRAGRAVATTVLEGDRHLAWPSVIRRIPRQHRKNPQHQGGLPEQQRRQRLHSLERTGDITLDTGASWIYHESGERFIPSSSACAGATSAARGRGAGAHCEKCETSARLSPGLVRRVRRTSVRQKRLEIIVPVSLVLISGDCFTACSIPSGNVC
jgi:hypothetical protein